MSFYVVHIPDNQPGDLTDHVEDVTAALAESYRGPIRGMKITSKAALEMGWCDACPPGASAYSCACTGDRSSCECYEHDTPEPKAEVPVHPFFPASPHRICCAAPAPLGAAGVCGQREDDPVHRIEVARG